ncbi:MAG: DNA gyrase subunit A, partial [Candidatus Aureabacteria bacterium]|nr:DNA gyrase subunit A [Candidatus Auribacterota bacterium]
VIELIKTAKNRDEARSRLMTEMALSEVQANAILEMRLYQITALEAEKIEQEYRELLNKIEEYKSILSDEKKIYEIIKNETLELADKYGDERKTSIEEVEGDFIAEDLIADEPCIISVSHLGYIKRVPTDTYRAQRRGGRGISGMETREEDYVMHLYTAKTHDTMLIFTKNGMLHWLKVYAIPEGSRTSRGKSIANLLEIGEEDKIASIISVREFDNSHFVVMVTQNGTIKKTALSLFSNIRKKGIIAINIRENDKLISAAISTGHEEILLITKEGQAIRFSEKKISSMGRTASGVRGIKLEKEDLVVGMEIISSEEGTLLVVCENGFGKRTHFSDFRETGRAGKGIIAIKTTDRNGLVVSAQAVTQTDDLMLITSSGMMVRVHVSDIPVIGRNTQGVRVVNLKEGDKLVSMTLVQEESFSEEPVSS